MAEEHDQLATQLAEQVGLLQKAQKEAKDKEAGLLAEFEIERSAWTDKEARLTAGFGEIEDLVDGRRPSLLFFYVAVLVSSRLLSLCSDSFA